LQLRTPCCNNSTACCNSRPQAALLRRSRRGLATHRQHVATEHRLPRALSYRSGPQHSSPSSFAARAVVVLGAPCAERVRARASSEPQASCARLVAS
jgi:hypothetical protein